MKTTASLVLAGAGLAVAAPRHSHGSSLFSKRTPYDLCDTDCRLAGLAYPDVHTLQIALENNWSEQCPQVFIGDASNPTATSRVCLDISGTNVLFNFEAFSGYTYNSASVTWSLAGNAISQDGWAAPPPTSSLTCAPNGDGYQCTLPFSSITGLSSSAIGGLLAGMCPNGDREGLGLWFEFSGAVTSTADSTVSTVANSSPCVSHDSTGACTARNTDIPYFAMVYRCSMCNIAACPPPPPPATSTTTSASSTSTSSSTTSQPPAVTTTCSFGAAFGNAGTGKATALNTIDSDSCETWGWYSAPTLAQLQAAGGVTGTLLSSTGSNDVSKATNVGTYVATADASGKVTVTYKMASPYTLTGAHVDLVCTPISKCTTSKYTFVADGLKDLSTYAITPVAFPTCKGSSKAALIVHATVDVVVQGKTCPKKKEEDDD
jgi:hypothetical protein